MRNDKSSQDWQLARFDAIMTRVDRKFTLDDSAIYNCVGVRWYGKGTFVREQRLGLNIARKQQWRVKSGDVVYNKLFAWKGAFAIADDSVDGCIVSDKFPTYQIDSDKVDPRFLGFYFQKSELAQQAQRLSKGAAAISKLTLNPPQFWDLTLPLPSLAEQRRIVARVEQHASKVDHIRSLRQLASLDTDALAVAACYQMRNTLLRQDLPRKKIGEIAQVTSGGTPSRDNPIYWGGSIPWVTSGELLDGDIYKTIQHITKEGLDNSSAKLFPPGTVLVGLYGQGQTRGRTGLLMIQAATNQACCAVLPVPSILEARFTQYWLRGLYHDMRARSRNGAQPNWNGQMIKNIEIAMPSVSEQRRIVNHLDCLKERADALRLIQRQTAPEIDALMPSILDKAFKGQL